MKLWRQVVQVSVLSSGFHRDRGSTETSRPFELCWDSICNENTKGKYGDSFNNKREESAGAPLQLVMFVLDALPCDYRPFSKDTPSNLC